MTLDELIKQVRGRIAERVNLRATHTQAIDEVRTACLSEKRDPSEDEQRKVKEAQEARAKVDAEIDQERARLTELEEEKRRDDAAAGLAREFTPDAPRPHYDEVARTGQEPRTYTRERSRSGEARFFADAWNARKGNVAAKERVERHAAEVMHHGEMSERALATGGIAGLVVPQYLIDLAAPVLRAGRPLANLVNRHPLPEQGLSLVVPRGTTGAATAVQATENTALTETDEVWANLTIPVTTVGGQAPVSRQALERAEGMDEIIFMDLARAYAANIDNQVINGTGSGNQVLGILNTAGIGAATAFAAALTTTNFTLKKAGQIAAVAQAGAGIQAKVIVMHPRRWGWATAQVDTQGRPIVLVGGAGPFNALAVANQGAAGETGAGDDPIHGVTFQGLDASGLPILTDLNIPTAVGTNSEDVVLVLDTDELHLWEDGDGMPKQLTFEQTAGQNLTTTLVVYNYAAFTAGRYPGAVGKLGGLDTVGGQGLIAPTF